MSHAVAETEFSNNLSMAEDSASAPTSAESLSSSLSNVLEDFSRHEASSINAIDPAKKDWKVRVSALVHVTA